MPITIVLPSLEAFDDEKQKFVHLESISITLEHSLISLSRWESKWHKFFLGPSDKTDKETLSYIQSMGLYGEIPEEHMARLTEDNLKEIYTYIQDPMTATTFSHISAKTPSREMISSELIYYWMHSMGIDKTCEEWPLARLIALIRLTSEKNQPAKKRNPSDVAAEYRSINERNKKLFEQNKEGAR